MFYDVEESKEHDECEMQSTGDAKEVIQDLRELLGGRDPDTQEKVIYLSTINTNEEGEGENMLLAALAGARREDEKSNIAESDVTPNE